MSSTFNGVSVDGIPVDGISVKVINRRCLSIIGHYIFDFNLEAKGNGNVPI
jgi:hypothetical protein